MQTKATVKRQYQILVRTIFSLGVVVAIVIAFVVYAYAQGIYKKERERRFNDTIVLLTNKASSQLEKYKTLLLTAGSLVSQKNTIDPELWNNFGNTLEIKTEFRGVSSVFFLRPVNKENLSSELKAIRNDTSINGNGYPFVKDTPESGIAETEYVVYYVYPEDDGREMIVGNLLNETKSTLESAILLNQPVVSEVFMSTSTTQSPVVSVFYPIVDSTGQFKSAIGLSFRTDNLFVEIMGNLQIVKSLGISFEVENPKNGEIIFASDEITLNTEFTSQYSLDFFNQRFITTFYSNEEFQLRGLDQYLPLTYAIAAGSIIIIISGVIAFLLYSRLVAHLAITNIKEDLALAQDIYETVFDQATQMITILHTNGRIKDINQFGLGIAQVDKTTMTGKYLWDLDWWSNEKEQKVKLQQSIHKAASGIQARFESYIKPQEKDLVPLDISVNPVIDDNGKVILIVIEARDISDAKAYEDTLEQTNSELQRFKEAVDNSSDHMILTDKTGKIIYANKMCQEITGYSYDEIIGKNPSLWGGQMDKEYYKTMWETIAIKKQRFGGEIINKRKDGRLYEASVRIIPVLDDNGDVKFFVGIERDISEEKEIERSKNEFVSIASHQLRTPLTGMKWFLELIETETKLTDQQKEYVGNVQQDTERMIRLVNDLLNVSRIETGRNFEVTKTVTSLKKVINNAIRQNTPRATKENIEFVQNIEDVNFQSDEKKISEAFDNLVDNAVKYSRPNGKVEIEAKQEQEQVVVKIKDHGIGIPDAQKDKIFTKFFRANNALKEEVEGSGLGLYIVKSIIEKHGGSVEVESQEGSGTTIIVKLPLA